MRKLTILLAIFGLVLTFSMPAMAADAGKWEVSFEGPMGPETWKMDLKADGTADGEHPMFGIIKGKNNCAGEKFDVLFKLDTPMGEKDMSFVGKISGASAKGSVEIMGAPVEWTGEKK